MEDKSGVLRYSLLAYLTLIVAERISVHISVLWLYTSASLLHFNHIPGDVLDEKRHHVHDQHPSLDGLASMMRRRPRSV